MPDTQAAPSTSHEVDRNIGAGKRGHKDDGETPPPLKKTKVDHATEIIDSKECSCLNTTGDDQVDHEAVLQQTARQSWLEGRAAGREEGVLRAAEILGPDLDRLECQQDFLLGLLDRTMQERNALREAMLYPPPPYEGHERSEVGQEQVQEVLQEQRVSQQNETEVPGEEDFSFRGAASRRQSPSTIATTVPGERPPRYSPSRAGETTLRELPPSSR